MTAQRKGWRPSAGEITVMALVGVFILVGKVLLRMPVKTSGHAGVLWIAALIIGRGVVRRPGAATIMAFVGGALIVMFFPNASGLFFPILKYVVPGMVLDVLAWAFGDRLYRIGPAIFTGAVAHVSKIPIDYLELVLKGIPAAIRNVQISADTVLHIGFGALGGLIGALVLKALIRARIPQLRDLPSEGDAS